MIVIMVFLERINRVNKIKNSSCLIYQAVLGPMNRATTNSLSLRAKRSNLLFENIGSKGFSPVSSCFVSTGVNALLLRLLRRLRLLAMTFEF